MKTSNKVVLIYIIVSLIISLIFYPIIPTILNYPPNSINNEFQSNVDIGLLYNHQYLIIVFISILSGIILLKKTLKSLDKLGLIKGKDINKIFNLPYKVYAMQILIPFIVVILLYAFSELNINMGTLKISIVILTFETLISLIVFIYCKNLISILLEKQQIDNSIINSKKSLKNRMLLTLLPMIIVALIFTALIGYSRLIIEKSEYVALLYKNMLGNTFNNESYSLPEAKTLLEQINLTEEKDTRFYNLL